MRRRYGYCYPCGKRRYATEEAAQADLARMQSLPKGDPPTRVYECTHGWWHTTSMPPAKWTAAYAGEPPPPPAADVPLA